MLYKGHNTKSKIDRKNKGVLGSLNKIYYINPQENVTSLLQIQKFLGYLKKNNLNVTHYGTIFCENPLIVKGILGVINSFNWNFNINKNTGALVSNYETRIKRFADKNYFNQNTIETFEQSYKQMPLAILVDNLSYKKHINNLMNTDYIILSFIDTNLEFKRNGDYNIYTSDHFLKDIVFCLHFINSALKK